MDVIFEFLQDFVVLRIISHANENISNETNITVYLIVIAYSF